MFVLLLLFGEVRQKLVVLRGCGICAAIVVMKGLEFTF